MGPAWLAECAAERHKRLRRHCRAVRAIVRRLTHESVS